MDLLGRPPSRAERQQWLGRALPELLDALLSGEELWDHWTEEQLYYFLLIDNFRPRSDGVVSIPADLRERRIGVKEAVHRIALSASFDQRNPGPDTFVTVVLEQFLGVTVQKDPRELEAGKRVYDGHKGLFLGREGASQADVVRIAIEDPRFLPYLLEREHQRILRRPAPRKSLSRWVERLEQDPYAFGEIVQEWLLSDAYETRLREEIVQPNRLYVRAMYIDLTDGLPDKEDERRMRNALDGLADPGPLRSVLARLVLESGAAALPAKEDIADPAAWIAELFDRLYGRAAAEPELASFVTAFRDPDCRPATVVYALVSHPEYHLY